MDLVTHTMTGFLVGSVSTRQKQKLGAMILAGAVAGSLPDLDAWLYLVDLTLYYKWHRVFTHTVFALPFLAALAALAGWLWIRNSFLKLYIVSAITLILHLFMDYLCEYKLFLLYPLNRTEYQTGYFNYSSPAVAVAVTSLLIISLYFHQKRWKKQEAGTDQNDPGNVK